MSRLLRRTMTVLVASALTVGTLASPAFSAEASRYVALGDSFVAGPLVPDHTGSPAGCLRSTGNYPSLMAADLGVDEFLDVSCSGAVTDDMFNAQNTAVGTNPPQLDALNEQTTLVTLGIGGNDVGFANILVDCLLSGSTQPVNAPCQDKYTHEDGTDQLQQRIDETKPKVESVLGEIANRAPNAQVIVVGYPAILPEADGCWPKVPLAKGDIPYLDGIEQSLNSALADAANAHGATYVENYERGHDVCAPRDARWVEGVIPTKPAAPVHPNADGMQAVAQTVLGSIA
ncbi:MAG TPA: SGNH/GDSL hydrolase family protein [Candidatus Stackebrandtia faecavium]|nr:SGNH/GDSL hydrolase family protein [Candidatus Stackebrandtia faecavium]